MSDSTTRPGVLPSSPPPKDAAQPLVYRPLSLLAMAGCGLAGLYAAYILIGGLVAFVRGTPWLQGAAWVLVPIAATVLSIIGLVRIQRSEGTLAGEKAARWGILLSILFGLGYWAYFGATYVAIAREADQFSREFLDKLSRGEELDGFRLTLPPDARPAEGAAMRGQLEQRFNGLNEQGRPGLLTSFKQDEKVRLLEMGGPEGTTIESHSVGSLEYASGSYKVQLEYRIKKPHMEMVYFLPVVGRAGKHSEGRQWSVDWSQVMMLKSGARMTEFGDNLFQSNIHARNHLGEDWLPLLLKGKKEALYFETLLPAERGIAVSRIGLFGGTMASGCPALAQLGYLPQYEYLCDRTLVQAGKDFWAPDDVREEVLRLVHEAFRHPGEQLMTGLQFPMSAKLPRIQVQGDRVDVELDLTLTVPLGAPRYHVEGRLVMDYDAAELGNKIINSWRVRHVDLIAARSIPAGMTMRPDMMRR